ncbi:MAG: heat-inducible transcription repressor HrcA [Deltaproteobacteria bacterium]|nr:MAG: heat-inducible transcription repressor HrcA [Deltaproteobacteria bacterium]
MAAKLTDRGQTILEAIIEEYIATAQPVGSKALTQNQGIKLSPASVRNVMAELEELGYLVSPHTSAGRIPTEKGYRFYVDTILRVSEMDRRQKDRIELQYRQQGLQMTDMLREASRTLSSISHYTGLVMVPRLKATIFRHIEFVKLSQRLILAVFVTQSGLVQNKLVEVDEDLSPRELEKITNYLNQTMNGLSIQDVRTRIITEMAQEKALYDQLMRRAFTLSSAALVDESNGDVIIEGTSRFLEQPEFSDLDCMKRIVQTFEQKSALVELLDRGLESKGVQVIIGSETEHTELSDCSLITAAYSGKRGTLGTLGVIGPNRMPYATIIPIVDYTASLISRLLDTDND